MNDLIKFYETSCNFKSLYTKGRLRNIRYKVHFALSLLVFLIIVINIILLVAGMIIKDRYFMPVHYSVAIAILGFFRGIYKILIKKLHRYRDKCLEDIGYDYTMSRYKFIFAKEKEKIKNYLIDNCLFEMQHLLQLEHFMEERINSNTIISRQKFKLSSYLLTVIVTIALTEFANTSETKALFNLINSNGYEVINVLSVMFAMLILFGIIKLFDLYIQKMQELDLESLRSNINSIEISIQKILIDLIVDLTKISSDNTTSEQRSTGE